MKKILGIFLGVLTAIGGFVDIGDIVANAETGARFKWGLAWAVVVGVIGIVVFAEMSGRVAAVSGRATFDLVRERLGPRVALANLAASVFVTFLTLLAEIGGVALALELATSVNYLLWIPLVGFGLWLVIWRLPFSAMEQTFGLLGLCLVTFAVAVVHLGPDWGSIIHQSTHPSIVSGEGAPTYWFFAISLFGAWMTPYEVFFFSSGAVEEHWSRSDLNLNRANVFIGFPLGGVLSLALMSVAALVLNPLGISVGHLGQAALPVNVAMGRVGLALVLVGFFAATFGAALETALSTGYTIAQYFGWQWGKLVRPTEAARFHVVVLVAIGIAMAIALTSVDPITVTEYSLVFSAVALPLTYFPILVVANDPTYMGTSVNGRLANTLGSVYMLVIAVVAVVAIPLMIATKVGRVTAARNVDAGRELLDHQLIDRAGMLCGNVDDIAFTVPDDGSPPIVSGLLAGPGVLADRVGGRLGHAWAELQRRLHPSSDDLGLIPMHVVSDIGSVVRLSVDRADLATDQFEWLAP